MKTLKAVIVEDSRLARNELKELLNSHKEIELIGEAANVDEGFSLITAESFRGPSTFIVFLPVIA